GGRRARRAGRGARRGGAPAGGSSHAGGGRSSAGLGGRGDRHRHDHDRAPGDAVRRREAGGATLATALIVLLAASLLGAAVAEIARTELVVAESRRTLARGLAAGDACLARAVATLPAG